ncbi:MAG: head-tail adaptor protein [Amphritea sp.]|nr:head-tail adaptor protein [Amphritea sp.]
MKRQAIGNRNQKIVLFKPAGGQSPSGAPIKHRFIQVAAPWASVQQKSVAEDTAGDQDQYSARYEIGLAWRENLRPGWLIMWRKQLLKVIAVDDSDPRRQNMLISAETSNAAAELEYSDNTIVDQAINTLADAVNG